MSPVAQVPSHTPLLIDKFLDMISDNKMGHRIPTGLHFKDKSGDFLFHARVAPYLQGCTARINANVLTPHGGGAGSNNATESQNKIAHKQMPTRKPPVAHVGDLLSHMHTVSMADTAFSDGMRRDIWHHDMMIAVAILMKWQPYPACPTCIFNLAGCTFRENVYIESLDPAQMRYAPSAAGGRQDRVVDFRTAMTSAPQQCIVMPTFKTMMTVIQNYPAVFQTHKAMTNTDREKLIKNFLSAPTQKPKVGPSWLSLFLGLFNVRSELALEDVTLTEWYDVVHSFALMPPLTDKDSVARYLGRLEKGIPIRDKTSTRLGNGCQVHWDQVPHTGIYYCLCPDHLLRGICLHVMLWLVSNTIISLPSKWSAAMIAGPSMKGRDSNFVNGTARVRDDSQSSKHAAAKIARSVRDPRSHDHTAQALISCLGTIDTETDSVRKYVNQQYKYGLQLRKGKLPGSKKSKKREGKRSTTPTLPSISESDESISEQGEPLTNRKRKQNKGRIAGKPAYVNESLCESLSERGETGTHRKRKHNKGRRAGKRADEDESLSGSQDETLFQKKRPNLVSKEGQQAQRDEDLSQPCSSKKDGKNDGKKIGTPSQQALGGAAGGARQVARPSKVCVCACVCACVCVCVCVRLLSLVLMCYLALHNQGKGYVHVAPRGQALSREPASAKYVTVLCMHTLSREDKMSILRVMMQGEADQALHAFLQDRLGHDQCDLDGLCKLLQEAD